MRRVAAARLVAVMTDVEAVGDRPDEHFKREAMRAQQTFTAPARAEHSVPPISGRAGPEPASAVRRGHPSQEPLSW